MPGEIPALLAMAFRGIMDEIHERLAAEGFGGLRPAHGFVFQYLSFHPDATAVDLGEHLGVSKQAAAALVDELDRRGYVVRRPHPSDGRSRIVALTERGWACIERVLALGAEIEERWAEMIGAERLTALREDLAAYVSASGTTALRPVW